MEAYSAPAGYVFSLNAGGRSGTFDVIAGDFSTELAADTLNGIYVGLTDDPTATTKVAKRRLSASGVTPEMFGAVKDGTTDDKAAIIAALQSGAADVYASAGIYSIDVGFSITVSGVNFYGPGKFLTTFDGISLSGDNNTVSGITVYSAVKSTDPNMIYSESGIELGGDNCHVSGVEVYNIGGSGVTLSGRNVSVTKSIVRDNISGVRLNNKTRKCIISSNIIKDNNVNNSSGADGILASRSVIGLLVENNVINNSGEHGVYFQGQRGIFKGNIVGENTKDGLKFGSYEDGLYEYPGETLYKWVDGDSFGLAEVIIDSNYIYDNGGEDGIYFQPSSKNVVVSNNILKNNRIRWVYFNAGDRLEDHIEITVSNNNVTGTNASIDISAYSNVNILGNYVQGEIRVYMGNDDIEPRLENLQIKPNIGNNECNIISLVRSNGANVYKNATQEIFISPGSASSTIEDCKIFAQTISIDTVRIKAFNRNSITMAANVPFNASSLSLSIPFEFCGNTLDGGPFTGSYFINSDAGESDFIKFSNNTISLPNSDGRVSRLRVNNSVISGNIYTNAASEGLRLDGDDNSVTGNKMDSLYIESSATGNVVVGNKATFTGTSAGNTVTANG
jgi:hypothetical protein